MREDLCKIIQIKSTDDAIRFGSAANHQQIKLLRIGRPLFLAIAKSYPRESIKDLEMAMFFATQAQFMREALAAAGCSELGFC